MSTPRPAFISSCLRAPQVPAGGALAEWDVVGMTVPLVRDLLHRNDLDPACIDSVVLGCCGPPARAPNPARVVALEAGLAQHTPALTVQRSCGSGLEAVWQGAMLVASGRCDVVLAGGMEHMSSYPLLLPRRTQQRLARLARTRGSLRRLAVASGFRRADLRPEAALRLALTDPVTGLTMGETAEILRRRHAISREAQDRYAAESHRRARAARDAGRLGAWMTPLYPPPDHAPPVISDAGIREAEDLQSLPRRRPAFDPEHGTVTAGNSCGITDGAALCLIVSEEAARREGLPVQGRVAGWSCVGCAPETMGLGPVAALPGALREAGIGLEDCAVVELNEAFAAQVLACLEALRRQGTGEVDPHRLNPDGGAIALGHPVGATGARLVGMVLAGLERHEARWGVATLCIGGGQGAALVLERGG